MAVPLMLKISDVSEEMSARTYSLVGGVAWDNVTDEVNGMHRCVHLLHTRV